MRCLTLAEALASSGWRCAFLSVQGSEETVPPLRQGPYRLVPLGARADAALEARRAWPEGADLLVSDGYGLDERFERACRPWARRILAIDDLADRPHDCDFLLDQNLQPSADRYAGLAPGAAVRLLGPRFALLRPGFARLRAQQAPRDGTIRRILVFAGGTDAGNFSATLLGAVARLAGPPLAVDVVAGRASEHLAALASRCEELPDCRLHVQTPSLEELAARADLALGGVGGHAWERCALGLPAVMAAIADNQRMSGEMLARCRAGIFLGDAASVREERLATLLEQLRKRPRLVRRMAARAFAVADGLGAARVAALLGQRGAMAGETLLLRPAHALDMRFAFDLRNDPEVYARSFVAEPVDWETHRRWFSRALEDPGRRLLIVEDLSASLGTLRIDLKGDEAELSIALSASHRGRGVGSRALLLAVDWARSRLPGARRLVAHIRPGNKASASAFERAGFQQAGEGLYSRQV